MDTLFAFHKLNQTGQAKALEIARLFDNLASDLHKVIELDGGREWSIVRTKLEEACFFAKKAMAVKAINQELEDGNVE